jgi:hypothetical protein
MEHQKTRNNAGFTEKEHIEFNQNHWKVIKPKQQCHNKAERFSKTLSDKQLEDLHYKYFQTSDYYHSLLQQPA